MEEDVTKIYEEYSEELLFCKYFIAEKLKHMLRWVDVEKTFSKNVSRNGFKC